MKILIRILIIFLLVSCNERELGDNYYYLPEYEAREYLTGVFIYKSEDENVFSKIIIYPDVEELHYNDQYIIAKQKPNINLMKKRIVDNLELWNNYYKKNKKDSVIDLMHGEISLIEINLLMQQNKLKDNDSIINTIFETEMFYKNMFSRRLNYYIIQKDNDSVFGPLSYIEYRNLRERKKIKLDFKSSKT
jgi:tRNA splicing endonuclease